MRLSPFPPGADRPWRGVLIYAWHGVFEQLRSPMFWLSMFLLPAFFVGMGVFSAQRDLAHREEGPSRFVVVAPDDAVRAHVEAVADTDVFEVVATAPGADHPAIGTLTLDGADVTTITPKLTMREGTGTRRSTRWMSLLWLRTQAHALDPDAFAQAEAFRESAKGTDEDTKDEDTKDDDDGAEVAAEEAASVAEEHRRDIKEGAAKGAPSAVGFVLIFSMLGGFTAGAGLVEKRDKDLFVVLRVGTPAAVIFLGGLIETATLAVVRFLPYLALVVPIMLFGALFLGGPDAVRWVVPLPLVTLCGGVLAYLAGAGAGGVLHPGASDGPKPARSMMGLVPMLLLPAVFGLSGLPDGTGFDRVAPFAAVPLFGLPVFAKSIVLGRGIAWGVLGLALSAGVALVSVRIGSWGYAQDERGWSDIRRALRRGGAR